MSSVIHTEKLNKTYGNVRALNDINLTVDEGELFGLIGPDGAGKTSLIRILSTLILADDGNAEVLGREVVKDYKYIRNHMGYMPGRFSLYQDLTIIENLELFASIYETTIEENYHLIKDIYTQIEPFKHRRAGDLSGGMKQKLALSCALIHQPKILFLDEPTTGVDPVSRKEFWAMLKNLKKAGITIFVSTPYMDEAALCDKIALIQEGKILAIDTPKEVLKSFDKSLLSISAEDRYDLIQDLKAYQHAYSVYAFGSTVHYTDKRNDFELNEIQQYLDSKQHKISSCEKIEPGIEDCFMYLMSKEKDNE